MKSRVLALILAAGAMLAPLPAHHYLVASYYFDRTIDVKGRVVEFLFRSPHSFVRVDAQGQTWLAEWGPGSQLSRAGVSKDTLKRGDEVIVTGHPPRNAEHKVRVVTIVRPSDGWKWTEER